MNRKKWTKRQREKGYLWIKQHFMLIVFVLILLALGVVFGALIVGQLDVTQKGDLKVYLQSFFGMMGTNTVANPSDIFQSSLWNHLKLVGFIWILGISIVGCPLILFLLFLKGAMLGFSIGLLVSEFGFKGFVISFGTVFLQNLLIIPFWIVMVTVALSFSYEGLKCIVKRAKLSIGKKFFLYHCCFMILGVGFILPTMYEAFISPKIIKFVVERMFS